ncbi:hypothetical protein WNY37_09920 [Henriciella sp. AS95]|uniref:hypothetical protein n=1 Tax=Henriciella sp. AS95 TaxID=3135782 RepID=UPI0031827C11
MSRKTRTFVYAAGAFAIMLLMIVLMAWQQGVDPFHPRTRMYWLAAVVTALYLSLRGAVFVERLQFRRSKRQERVDTPSRLSKNIDDRMAARKARVEAARARQNSDEQA